MRSGRVNGRKPAAGAILKSRPVLITGGAGFIGSNLAERLAGEGENVLIVDSLTRPGVERNLAWLKQRHPRKISHLPVDIRDAAAAAAVADCAAVFHLAAQVAVTTSIADPLADLDVNARATLLLLEASARQQHAPPFIFASTNKVYGDLADIDLDDLGDCVVPRDAAIARHGIGERRALDFHTPYGCSKGAADLYVLDYARMRGLPAAVLRMSCIYGPRQLGTEDQGWVAHFLIRALADEPITIFGDGRQVRDVLYVDDAVEAYVRAWRSIGRIGGRAFNLGGGPQNAISLLQLLRYIGDMHLRRPQVVLARPRASDQRYFVADRRAIASALDLPAPLAWRDGVGRFADWLICNHPRKRAVQRAHAGTPS